MSFTSLEGAANTCYGLVGLSLGLYLKPPATCPPCTCGTVHCGAVTESRSSWSDWWFALFVIILLTTGAWGLWRHRVTPATLAAPIGDNAGGREPQSLRRSFAATPEFAHYGGAVRR